MSFLPKWAVLALALASIALMSGPASASAKVTPVVQGSKLTVVGNSESDTIKLIVVDGKLVVEGVTTPALNANTEAEIVVEANGGSDNVNASALAATNYKSLSVSGGEGEDTITGGAGNDTIAGGAANDRLIGFKGDDTVSGGDGNDRMFWQNGDGSDTDEGGAGLDSVESSGNDAAEAYRYAPKGTENEVHFERLPNVDGKGLFSIDLNAEVLIVLGLGGDDSFEAVAPGLAGRTQLVIHGGEGNDDVKGGDGEDVLNGNEGNDMLIGAKGSDSILGGEGDDVMVWNNGDESDHSFGETGNDEVVINGSAAAGDVVSFKPENVAGDTNPFPDEANQLVLFARSNPDPFTIELEAEQLTVNGLGGDDVMTPDATSPAGLLPGTTLTLDGGEGNDMLVGGDILIGGAGKDVVDGGEGKDQLFTRDGTADVVHGGEGFDRAQTDAVDVDTVDGVEELDATPSVTPPPVEPPAPVPAPVVPPDHTALLPTLGRVGVLKSGKRLLARVPVSCPVAETGGCRMTLTLRTARAVRVGSARMVLLLGSKSATLSAGGRATLAIRLNAKTSTIAKGGKLAVRVKIASTDSAGNTATRIVALMMKVPHR